MALNPMVVDLSHHNKITSFAEAYKRGIRGVIYKATEGKTYVDPTYKEMRVAATAAGMLWGAYHFFRPLGIPEQVDHFIKNADPDDMTLLALDHEDDGCSAADAEHFMKLLEAKTGQVPVLYSGHLIKDQLGNQVHDYFGSCRLWLAQYGSTPYIQASWDAYWIWQFTGDGMGPEPHTVPGLGGDIDINTFNGTEEQLRAQWAMRRDASGSPLPKPAAPTSQDITKWGQASLNLLGCTPPLVIDGLHGPNTTKAVQAYQKSRSLGEGGFFTPETKQAMVRDLGIWASKK